MLRHRRVSTNTSSSLTFVGSSENVGRVPSPSPARSRHYQTPHVPRMHHDITLTDDPKMIVDLQSSGNTETLMIKDFICEISKAR